MIIDKIQRTTLTMKEAGEYLGISYWLINQLVRRKKIPCSKVGGKYLGIMAGPCSVESEKQIVEVAKAVKASGANFLKESEERRIWQIYNG